MSENETPYRAECRAFLSKWAQEMRPLIVDVGGKNTRSWMESVIPGAFETWDKRPGRSVKRTVDIERARSPQEVATGSVGTLIITSVLEHVRRPWRAAENIGRIVAPGGLLLVTMPFAFPFHPAPDDYWRATAEALAVLFDRWFLPLQMDMFTCADGTIGSVYAGRRQAE
jgi:SAM-dependent methyltransferase